MILAPSVVFQKPVLTKITGKPDYRSIKRLTKELYANAKAIRSNEGGGTNGHLGVIMPDTEYQNRAGVAFTAPIHPGTMNDQTGNTAAVIEAAKHAYEKEEYDALIFEIVDAGLKSQIVAAVHRRYYKTLEDDEFGLTDISTRDILAHLTSKYAKLTADDLEKNRNELSATFNPDNEIEALWDHVESIQKIAKQGGETISDNVAMNLVLAQIELTGIMQIDTQVWRKKPRAEQTMEKFQEHFKAALEEYKRQVTAGAAGYHGANHANAVIPIVPIPHEANSATAVVDDLIRMFYCWSHGLSKNPNHTSCTCTSKKPGHIDTATVSNMLGGNCYIIRDRGAAHRPPPRVAAIPAVSTDTAGR